MRIKHITFLISLFLLIIFTGCAAKIEQPMVIQKEKIKILEKAEGYIENKISIKKNFVFNEYYFDIEYNSLKWPKNGYKSICVMNNICLIDTEGKGYFTHSAVRGLDKLFPLNKSVKYSLLKKSFNIDYIDNIEIYHNKNIKNGIKTIYLPELNSIAKREIGEPMYEKINQISLDTYTVNINQKVNAIVKDEYSFEKEINIHFNKKYELLEWPEGKYKTVCEDNLCLIDKDNKNYFTHYAIRNENNLYDLNKKIQYLPIQDYLYDEDSFKYQALYQGKIDNKIRISFREFKNDMARPAFTQDIEYQLSPNGTTIIGFKGLRINVIKATNVDITYSVVKDFN